MNYNKTNITFTLIFYVFFQKLIMNEMDYDVNDLNEYLFELGHLIYSNIMDKSHRNCT